MEDGKVAGFKKSKDFFKMVLEDVYEGMFSDPVYGGNRDLAGWKLVGYPGSAARLHGIRADTRPAAQARAGTSRHAGDEPGRAARPRELATGRHTPNRGALAMAIKHSRVDVVTIGAGWTAAILAAKLCPDGTSMVSLEQGKARWTYPHFAHDHDSLRYSVRYALMVDLQRETWTWRPNPRSPALPMRQYGSFNPGMGLGGAAVHWSAQLWRYLDTDFRYRSHVVERYGKQKIPAGCTVQDWGVTYDELEPYYDAFEWDIGASGQAGNIQREEDPRRQPIRVTAFPRLPEPTAPSHAARRQLRRACDLLGLHPFTQPSGIVSRAWTDPHGNHRGGCLYCGFCTRFGCEVDAKASPLNTHLPIASTPATTRCGRRRRCSGSRPARTASQVE